MTKPHFMEQHLGQLMHATIVGIARDHDEEEGKVFFGLVVELDNRTRRKIAWIQCDPEGNGPGHLNIEDVEMPQQRARTPTPATLMNMNDAAGGRLFSKENLRLWGQRRSDFAVRHTEERGIYELVCRPREGIRHRSSFVISARTGDGGTRMVDGGGIPPSILSAHRNAKELGFG